MPIQLLDDDPNLVFLPVSDEVFRRVYDVLRLEAAEETGHIINSELRRFSSC